MSAEGKKLGVGVFCVDWRLHHRNVNIVEMVRAHLGVDGVDALAIPGPDGVFAPGREMEVGSLKAWLKLLIEAHGPVAIAFVGHYQCAGNPVDDATHDKDVEATMRWFKKETHFSGQMIALSATYRSDTEWGLKEVARA